MHHFHENELGRKPPKKAHLVVYRFRGRNSSFRSFYVARTPQSNPGLYAALHIINENNSWHASK